MNIKQNFKIPKIEIIGLMIMFIFFSIWGITTIWGNTLTFKHNLKYNTSVLQKEVNKYYYNNVAFPSDFQPTIGFPAEINMSKLKQNKLIKYSKNLTYMLDAYGEVYILDKNFSPPKNVDIITNSNNEVYMRWSKVENANSYGIREIKNNNTAMLDKAFGKVTASLLNITSKGKIIVEKEANQYNTKGNYITYKFNKYDPNTIYVVYAINKDLGETPGVGRGYSK